MQPPLAAGAVPCLLSAHNTMRLKSRQKIRPPKNIIACWLLECAGGDVRQLVSVHGHSLRAPADFPVGGRADGSAATAVRAALLQGQKLLGTESLVVDLRCGLNEVLEMGAEQEVSQIGELAVVLVLDVDHAPAVLAATDLLAVDDDGLLGANNSEGNQVLQAG